MVISEQCHPSLWSPQRLLEDLPAAVMPCGAKAQRPGSFTGKDGLQAQGAGLVGYVVLGSVGILGWMVGT